MYNEFYNFLAILFNVMENRPIPIIPKPDKPKTRNLKITKKMLIIIASLIIVAVIVLVVLIFNSSPKAQHSNKLKAKSSNLQTAGSYPKANLNCSNSISIMPLTSDFSITDLNCTEVTNNQTVISCDGTILHQVVNINCYQTPSYSYNNELICNGATGSILGNGNLPINYTCYLPSIANTVIYNCSGNIVNYASTAINYSMIVSCSP